MSRVLVIEDDTEFRDHLVHLIQKRGHEVVTADHGAAALAILQSGVKPNLILLDLMMPEMDGWMFRARSMTDPAIAKIPIVVLSGVHAIENEWVKLGAVGHLGKPVNLIKLYELIERYA